LTLFLFNATIIIDREKTNKQKMEKKMNNTNTNNNNNNNNNNNKKIESYDSMIEGLSSIKLIEGGYEVDVFYNKNNQQDLDLIGNLSSEFIKYGFDVVDTAIRQYQLRQDGFCAYTESGWDLYLNCVNELCNS